MSGFKFMLDKFDYVSYDDERIYPEYVNDCTHPRKEEICGSVFCVECGVGV